MKDSLIQPLLVLFVGGIMLWLWFRCEPRADGHTLSDWLVAYSQSTVTDVEASNAICKIGPKAIPRLIAGLSVPPSDWMHRLYATGGNRLLPDCWLYRPWFQHQDAALGFFLLGTQAVSALPELSRMLLDTNMDSSSAFALGCLGPQARPALLAALTNTCPEIRIRGIVGLMATKEMALAATTNVLPLVKDPSVQVAMAVTWPVVNYPPPERPVTVGNAELCAPRHWVWNIALRRLVEMQRKTLVLPATNPASEHFDPTVREATNVFQERSFPTDRPRSEASQGR